MTQAQRVFIWWCDMKTCNKCSTAKKLDEFHLKKGTKDGRTTICKTCIARAERERYAAIKRGDHIVRPNPKLAGRSKPVAERFWPKVEIPERKDDCWIWCGGHDSWGYGTFVFRGRQTGAHRVVYILHYGEIPEGLLVCHTCDNPTCVNPQHLFLGTNLDNSNDKLRKGRFVTPRPKNRCTGERHRSAKLNSQQVLSIRERIASGEEFSVLAKDFNVRPMSIQRIAEGKSWKCVIGDNAGSVIDPDYFSEERRLSRMGRATRKGPLRKIRSFVSEDKTTQGRRVLLECGHETYALGKRKARCDTCPWHKRDPERKPESVKPATRVPEADTGEGEGQLNVSERYRRFKVNTKVYVITLLDVGRRVLYMPHHVTSLYNGDPGHKDVERGVITSREIRDGGVWVRFDGDANPKRTPLDCLHWEVA